MAVWAEKEISNYFQGVPVHQQGVYRKRAAQYVAQMKYAWFTRYGKDKVKKLYEIDYNDLKSHPMWIDKEKRGDFSARQYKV